MRRFLLVCSALLIVAAGGGLWFLIRPEGANPGGSVRGAVVQPAFWENGTLILSNTSPRHLLVLTKNQEIIPSSLPENLDIRRAAVSPDGAFLLLVTQEGSQQAFWRYEGDKLPVLLAASSGEVLELSFAPKQPWVAFREQRLHESTTQLSLLDLRNGNIIRVGSNVQSSVWLNTIDALVAVDDQNQMWFYGLQANGRVDAPQLLGSAYSNVLTDPTTASLSFVGRTDSGFGFRAFDLTKKEDRLLAPIDALSGDAHLKLFRDPHRAVAIALSSTSAEQENANLYSVDLATGATRQLQAIGRSVRWGAEGQLLIERVTAGNPQIWIFDSEKNQSLPLSDSTYFFAS